MNLTRTNWPLLWTPSASELNGNPSGLLRADNLTADNDGIISLIRGDRALTGTYPDSITNIHSKFINGEEQLWVAAGEGMSVVRGPIDGGGGTIILEGGGGPVAFGDALGYVLVTSGGQKKKDNLSEIVDLGLRTPDIAPRIEQTSDSRVNVTGAYSLEEGHDFTDLGDGGKAFPDLTSLRGILVNDCGSVDCINIGGQQGSAPQNDTFYFLTQLEDSSAFTSIRIEFPLDDDGSGNAANYYYCDIDVQSSTAIRPGLLQQSQIPLQRSQFIRVGDDTSIDWTTVIRVKVIFTANSSNVWFIASEMRWIGGSEGQLFGLYEWAYQYIADKGTYQAKSGLSPASDQVLVINGKATIQTWAAFDPQVTEVWIYRRSVPTTQTVNDNSTNATGAPGVSLPDNLDQWYRVGTVNPQDPGSLTTGGTEDTLADVDALELNILGNPFLLSVKDIPDPIIGMEGLYNERMLYISRGSIYLSDQLNPDAVDSRYTLRAFGDPSEFNLWIRKISNNQLLLATSKDLYSITGTLLSLPDGTIDATIAAVGEAYPPLCRQSAFVDGSIFYAAADGYRVTSGSNSTLLSPQLTMLFQGNDRYGVPAMAIYPGDTVPYSIAVGHSKLYCCANHRDLTRSLMVYDFIRKVWAHRYTDPLYVHVTQSDRILLGFGSDAGNTVQETEVGTDASIDGFEGQGFFLETVFDDNNQPRNRKDTFTLKVIADTGGVPVSVYVAIDGGGYQFVGSVTANGLTTTYFDMSAFTLGFRYSFQIIGSNSLIFKLAELTLEYDPRPEQVNRFQIQPANLGFDGRKRVETYAFVIDTLGHSVRFTPRLDGVDKSPVVFSTPEKRTFIYYFTDEEICTDINGLLESVTEDHPFEFYELSLNDIVTEKLPPPVKYLVIPPSNFGTPNRKRHTSYKFNILTRGGRVQFTPILDGVVWPIAIFNTPTKKTVEYFFVSGNGDVVAIDMGGILQSLDDVAFEYYGDLTPQQVEIFPPRLLSYYLPQSNLGTSMRKRVRTIPMMLNTNGHDVIFTPLVDNLVHGPTSTFNTPKEQTVYHFFQDDTFGIDYNGFLSATGSTPFEFKELLQPLDVEVLPLPRLYDQLGPMRFDKIGKLFNLRIRLIDTGNASIPFAIYGSNSTFPSYTGIPQYSGTFGVLTGRDEIYEIDIPKNVNLDMMRLVLGPTTVPFHRYDVQVRVSGSGMESDARWITLK